MILRNSNPWHWSHRWTIRLLSLVLPWLVPVTLLLSATHLSATISILVSDTTLIKQANTIVIGTVTSLKCYHDRKTKHIFTLVTLAPEEILKGQASSRELIIKQRGGRMGTQQSWVQGSPEFVVGEKVLLFLTRRADGTSHVAHLYQGKFSIVADARTGKEMAVRDTRPAGVRLLHPPGNKNSPMPGTSHAQEQPPLRELDSFKGVIHDVLEARHSSSGASQGVPFFSPQISDKENMEVIQNFRATGFSRWFEADNGLPVIIFMNADGEPMAQGNGFNQIRTGYQAWSGAAGSSFMFQDGGFTQSTGFTTDAINTISFGDPLLQIDPPVHCRGILAIGGFISNFNETRMLHGQPFFRIVEGDVVFNDGWEGCGLFEVFDNVAEVATHELGHLLGLGHTDDPNATMFPFVHFDGRGASLAADDLAGLVHLYPNTFTPPDPPILRSPFGITVDSMPTYSWDPVANAGLYQLLASNSIGTVIEQWYTAEDVGCSTNTSICSAHPNITLFGIEHQWKVRAANGAGSGAWSPSLTFTADSSQSVQLTVTTIGAEEGIVTSSPPGITCGNDCVETHVKGHEIILTATPNSGSVFKGWTGGGCSGTSPCQLTLTADTTVFATFISELTPVTTVLSAVLPSSRSVQIGSPATAFATLSNPGSVTATMCNITPATPIPAEFTYQTTDSHTNLLTGTVNAPVEIPPGHAQTFLLTFTPHKTIVSTLIHLNFDCSNTNVANTTPGLNTFLLSATSTPVPDIIAMISTINHHGIVNIVRSEQGQERAGVFSVAATNVGTGGTITISTDTGSASLPLTLTICETHPHSGMCMETPKTSLTTTIATNAIPTYGVFINGTGTAPFDPAINRIFVRFKDAQGITRGLTSVATMLPD